MPCTTNQPRWRGGRAARCGAGAVAIALAATTGAAVAPTGIAAAHAETADSATVPTLVVDAGHSFRPVTHLASGSLYGLADDATPSDDLTSAIKPNTFVQMAPGGHQLPNGEPKPAGDALVVAPKAARVGAKVVVRMPDWYPNFPYRWVSWDDWLNAVDTQVKSVQNSGAKNVAAYELWNEPDWTWDTAHAGSFNDGWTRTFNEVRSLDPTTPIQGPSFSDNISGMRSFLENAVATNTVPDIISWHELESSGKIAGDVATVTKIENSLGITPRPISIEEYATPSEVGVPGPLVGYIAKFERYGIHDAELAFWNHYGTLGDLLTDTGGKPNGAYWLYKWYGQMSGDMVATSPPAATGLDGAAAVTSDKKEVDAVVGGGSGPTAVRVDGLDSLAVGDRVDVRLEYTPSHGRTKPVAGPVTISTTAYTVDHGSITVPIVMNPTYGYHLVITPHSNSTTLAGRYTIDNLNSGLAMDTTGSATSDSTVKQTTDTGAPTQSWKINAAGSGLYRIINTASGLFLDIQDGSTTDGAPAVVETRANNADELWQLIPDGDGHVKFANYGTGKVLAVAGMSKEPGAAVVQWTDGAITSACTPSGPRAPGKIGTALDMCGTRSYVSMPDGVVSGLTGDYTVSAWVNPKSNATWSRLFDIGTGPASSMFLTLNNGSTLRFAITTSGSGGEQRIDGTGTLPLNTWSLVTVTLSGTTGTLYVNGKAVGTNTHMTLHPSDLGNTTQSWIGKSQYNDPALNGAVDDFNIYNTALTSDQVATLATGQPGAGNVVHYAFDEPGGTTVVDSSGNGRNATVVDVGAPPAGDDTLTPDHLWTLEATP